MSEFDVGKMYTELDNMFEDHSQQVHDYAEQYRKYVLIPFLKMRGWSFSSGMGTWSFWDSEGYMVDTDYLKLLKSMKNSEHLIDDEELGTIVEQLSIIVPGFNNYFGACMHSYKQPLEE